LPPAVVFRRRSAILWLISGRRAGANVYLACAASRARFDASHLHYYHVMLVSAK
jgi:hypothetical protein